MSCKGCERRTLGCHSACEDYKKQRKVCDERIEANRIDSVGRGYVAIRSKKLDKIDMKRRRRV